MDMGDPILGEHYIIFMSLHAPYSVIGKKMLEVGDPILLEHTSFLRFHMLHVQYLAKIVRHGDPILLKHRSFLHFHIHHIQWSVKKCQTWESQILGGSTSLLHPIFQKTLHAHSGCLRPPPCQPAFGWHRGSFTFYVDKILGFFYPSLTLRRQFIY